MTKKVDSVELVAIAAFAFVLGLSLNTPRSGGLFEPPITIQEDVLKLAQSRYGADKYSQGPEEWLIRDYFKDRREGVFVDVGAYDARKWSNTYRLEHDLGWSGLAIDALREFGAGYEQYRPRSRYVVAFVADRNGGTETIHINPNEFASSSGTDRFTRLFTTKTIPREVPVRTLDSLLEENQVRHVDLLSMDIELGEPVALSHFSIDRYRPALAVVEAQGETRQAILDYFAAHGYVIVGKYLHADPANLYFRPLDRNGSPEG